MCEFVGVAIPSEEERFELARRAVAFITPRVYAAFPGAIEAIRTLKRRGYTLHTASGTSSIDLEGILDGMAVRDCFGCLYGPDLIDTFKVGPEYYEQLFADVGIAPANAIVVDDSPHAINWAAQVGAQTVLVSDAPHAETSTTVCIGSLAELPNAIEKLD